MKMNAELLVGPELDDEIVQKLTVDIVVEIFHSHFHFRRITYVILVDL